MALPTLWEPISLVVALSLFQAGSLSVGASARIAGLPLPRFLELLSSLRIPVADASEAELDEDLPRARCWLRPDGVGQGVWPDEKPRSSE